MQVLDSLIDGALELASERDGNELIGMIVRYLRTGAEPEGRTDAQRAVIKAVMPVMESSRARSKAGSNGGSKTASKRASKPGSKPASKTDIKPASKPASKQPSKPGSKTASKRASEEEEERVIPKGITPPIAPQGGKPSKPVSKPPYAEIVGHLNAKAGTSYSPTSSATRSLINARFADGFTLDDFEAVIDSKCAEWLGDPKMARFIRPETLFGKKFEGYLNAPRGGRNGRAPSADAVHLDATVERI